MPGQEEKKQTNPNSLANLTPGNPGNRGNVLGSALTAQQFRGKAREEVTKRLEIILGILDDGKVHPRERLKAFEMLGRYAGLDVQKIAQTNGEGEDVEGVDRDAMLAIAQAMMTAARGDSPGDGA